MTKFLSFQRDFLKAVENPKYDTVVISGPRTLGKTFIVAQVLIRCLTPGDALHQPGKEYILGAATLEQARLTYSFIREALEPTGDYRWIDSQFRVHQFVGKHVPQVRREVGFLALHLGPGGTEVHEYWEVVALLIGNGSARSVHSVVGAGNRSACCMSASKCPYQALK